MNPISNKGVAGFKSKIAVFKKKFIARDFLSSRDNEKLKTPSYFSRQDTLRQVSGGLKKSENLTQVRVKNREMGSNFEIYFSRSPDTCFDAS